MRTNAHEAKDMAVVDEGGTLTLSEPIELDEETTTRIDAYKWDDGVQIAIDGGSGGGISPYVVITREDALKLAKRLVSAAGAEIPSDTSSRSVETSGREMEMEIEIEAHDLHTDVPFAVLSFSEGPQGHLGVGIGLDRASLARLAEEVAIAQMLMQQGDAD